MQNQGADKITWFLPGERTPDTSIAINRKTITFPCEMISSFQDKRVLIGVSKERRAIFFKPDKGGYKIVDSKGESRGRPRLNLSSKQLMKALEELTRGEKKSIEPRVMGDGSFGCFL